MAEGKRQRSRRVAQNSRAKRVPDKTETVDGRKEKDVESGAEEEKVRCFCGEDREFGEMASCELCSGWFHFRCMRFKEDVDLLATKDFVCCFCLASRTLSLLREVEGLKKEVKEMRERSSAEKGEIPTNRNDGRAERIPDGQSTGTDESSYSAVVKISGKKKQPHQEDPKPVSASPCKEACKVGSKGTSPRSNGNQRNGEEGANKNEKANNSQQSKEKSEKMVISQAARESGNTAKMKATEGGRGKGHAERGQSAQRKHIRGVRQVWGTKKQASCGDIAREAGKTVGNFGRRFSVIKKVGKVNETRKWWFILRAPEDKLQLLEEKWAHDDWRVTKVTKKAAHFLGMESVLRQHR